MKHGTPRKINNSKFISEKITKKRKCNSKKEKIYFIPKNQHYLSDHSLQSDININFNKYDLIESINKWKKIVKEGENKKEAILRIKKCYENNLPILDLSNLGLYSLPECLSILHNLKGINCSNNNLLNITDEIYKLTSLEFLDFSHNKIQNTSENITKLINLKTIKLDNNKLSSLAKSIEKLDNLEVLTCSNNNFSHFPVFICSLSNLTTVKFDHNKIKKIPEAIGKLKKLKSLMLSNNEIEKIPCAIGEIKSLSVLSLSYNKILKISDSIRKNKKLINMNFAFNHILVVPESLCELESLEILSLQNNRIRSLPENINKFTSLKKINLKNNRINIIPESFCFSSELRNANFACNEISSIPENIGSMKNLDILDFHDNNIANIPVSMLNIRNNCLVDIDDNLLPLPLSSNIATGNGRIKIKISKSKYDDYFVKIYNFNGIKAWYKLAKKKYLKFECGHFNKKIDFILSALIFSSSFGQSQHKNKVANHIVMILDFINKNTIDQSLLDIFLNDCINENHCYNIYNFLIDFSMYTAASLDNHHSNLQKWSHLAEVGITYNIIKCLLEISSSKIKEIKSKDINEITIIYILIYKIWKDKIKLFHFYTPKLDLNDFYFKHIFSNDEMTMIYQFLYVNNMPEKQAEILSLWRPWQNKIRHQNKNKYKNLNDPFIKKANEIKRRKKEFRVDEYNELISTIEKKWISATNDYYLKESISQIKKMSQNSITTFFNSEIEKNHKKNSTENKSFWRWFNLK